jgi:signal peptidase I
MIPNDGLKLPGSALPNLTPQPALNGAPVAAPRPKPQAEQPAVKDAFREVVETIVFVIVLVLLLKTFVAEAFVIPTGSMAETLLGYQKWVTCAQCGYEFPVNCSSEVDPQQGGRQDVVACTCPNCRYKEIWVDRDTNTGALRTRKEPPDWGSGDRVLVSKFPFDSGHLGRPRRFDVVVFKYPDEPQKGQTPMNYIKRYIGEPGETIAIYNGKVWVAPPGAVDYSDHPRPADPKDLWRMRPVDYTYSDDQGAIKAFQGGAYSILRKSPDLILAMRRIVFDNDHQPTDLAAKVPPRWQGTSSDWLPNKIDKPTEFRQTGKSGPETQWLHYKHLIVERNSTHPLEVPSDVKPQLIKNFMGYNTGETINGGRPVETNWVGDLILDCTAQVETMQGELILELSKSIERFQARFDLKDGSCTLWRIWTDDKKEEQVGRAENVITKAGTYALRFANVDDRLTVWVDGKLPFQDKSDKDKGGVDYTPAVLWAERIEHKNNYEPASVGVSGGAKLKVSHLQLWRDTYYTCYTDGGYSGSPNTAVRTMYVQPGHYLCLGDNSSESSDSRYWGLVPERLLLGRALMVYYPFGRAGFIR